MKRSIYLSVISLAVSVGANSLTVSVYPASPTQAIISYVAPDSAACVVEVSESGSYSPLVHDVDGSLFPGANLDSRAGTLTAGGRRIFLAGTRTIQTAANTNKYSRALQQNTLHYYRVTCGSQVITGTFTTKILPFGATYQDLPPTNPDGTYNYPSYSNTDRTEKIVDSQTGVLLQRVSLPSDNTYNSAPWSTAGGFGESCNTVIDAQGFYHCLFNDAFGGVFPNFYAIHPATGEVRFLGSAYFYRAEVDPAAFSVLGMAGGDESVMWDATDPNTVYLGMAIAATGRNTIVKWVYTGRDDPARNVGSNPQQSPHTVVDFLGGADLTALAHAFNPALDVNKFPCVAIGMQSHYAILQCARGYQNSYSWVGVFDMGNGLPLGSGGNGHMIAMAPEWARSGSRWCGDHSYEFLGSVPVYSFALHSLSGATSAPYDGGGPYTSILAGSVPSANAGDLTTISVTSSWDSQDWGATPGQFTPGEPVSVNPDHFLQTAQAGDVFSINSEIVRVRAKLSPTSWTIERGLIGSNAAAHESGAIVSAECEDYATLLTSAGGYLWWDFVSSPDGTDTSDWVINFGEHPVSRGRYRVNSGYPFRVGAVTDKTTWGLAPPFKVTAHPFFGGQSAPGDGNSFQKHPSMASGADATFFDETYFVGTSLFSAQNATATTHVDGTLYQYHYDTGVAYAGGTFMARKHFPTLTKTLLHSFADISGPGAVLTGTVADSYKYCVANAANECVAGSSRGDIFFNHPSLNSEDPWCTGGENGLGVADICIGNFASLGVAAMQYKIVDDQTGSLSYRPLVRTFHSFDSYISNNLRLTYGGEWAIFFKYDVVTQPDEATRIYAAKVPPIPQDDGIDRGTFVPASLSIVAPPTEGIVAAQVKFGYAEQGDITSHYCTSRREACVAASDTIDEANPFSYATTDAYRPMSCAVTCTIVIPVYPLHTAYYSVEFLDGNGAIVASSPGIAMETTIAALDPSLAAPAARGRTSIAGSVGVRGSVSKR